MVVEDIRYVPSFIFLVEVVWHTGGRGATG